MENIKQRTLWENILFIPNIRDESWVENLVALDKYKPRNIALLWPTDITIMNQSTQSSIEELLRLYGDLNIPHIRKENIVYLSWEKKISEMSYGMRLKMKDILQERPDIKKLSCFIDSTATDELAKYLSLKTERNRSTSEIINNKYIAQSELRRRGVLTPEWRLIFNESDAISFWKELTEKWYKKAAIKLLRAASGMWVFPVKTEEEIHHFFSNHALSQEEKENGILMDGWVKWNFISSPNIQFYVWKNQKDDVFLSCSEQILETTSDGDGVIHKWNISDMNIMYNNDILMEDLEKIKNWVREVWAFGIIWVDFVVIKDEDTGEEKAYFMEINGRINGSTPGAFLTHTLTWNHTQIYWWINNNISVDWVQNPGDFISYLEKEWLLYDPSVKNWVLPTNLSAIQWYNKAMILVVWKSKAHVHDLLSHLS